MGSRISRTALPILAILTVRATPAQVAVLAVLSFAPGIVLGLFVGAYVDRSAKRPLLIGADVARALLLCIVPAAAWSGGLAMPLLYGVAAAVGACSTLFSVADASFLALLIGPGKLVEGNAKLEATEAVAEAAGPGLAGILIQLLTAPVALLLDVASYLISAVLLSRIRGPEPPATAQAPTAVGPAIRRGISVCLAHPAIRLLLLAQAGTCFFGGFFLSLYLIYLLKTLALSAATTGVLIGLGGLGAFLGALAAKPLGTALGQGQALAVAAIMGQAANLFIPLVARAGGLAIPLLGLQQLSGDALLGAFMIYAVSLRQRELPQNSLGSANATFLVVTSGALCAGGLLAGPLVEVIGLTNVLWVGAIGGLLSTVRLLASPVRQLD